MNFAGEYLHIGDLKVDEILSALEGIDDNDWQKNQSHSLPNDACDDINCLRLVWDDQLRHNKPTKLPALQNFAQPIRPVLIKIADYYETSPKWAEFFKDRQRGYFIRASLEKINAGKSIPSHSDKDFSLAHSHRIYIPLVTNDDVFFDIGEMTLNLLKGEVVEVNNQKLYSIRNDSQEDCVHLVLDWVVPGE